MCSTHAQLWLLCNISLDSAEDHVEFLHLHTNLNSNCTNVGNFWPPSRSSRFVFCCFYWHFLPLLVVVMLVSHCKCHIFFMLLIVLPYCRAVKLTFKYSLNLKYNKAHSSAKTVHDSISFAKMYFWHTLSISSVSFLIKRAVKKS